jgi:outer membrane receptor protein involved in Fe transport
MISVSSSNPVQLLMRSLVSLCLVLLCHPGFVHAQFMPGMGGGATKIYDGKISGTIIDSLNNKPVEFASVALYEKGSEKPIDGVITDEKGNFRIKNLKKGTYRIGITFIGYVQKFVDSLVVTEKKPSVEVGTVRIGPSATMLKEANVEAEKQLIETRIDKLVYNADKDITSKGGNATDILRKVPMLSVDLDGNVSLQGTQNVRILINNKPSSLMSANIADALKMIPADEIEKVEVITSPSAKYDAEGTGGIINIITKKKNIEGLSGSINAGAGTRSSNLFGNLNYRSGRFGTGISGGGFGWIGIGDVSTTRVTQYSTLKQEGDNRNTGFGPSLQWTGDVDLTSKLSLSTSLRVNNFQNRSKGTTDNFFAFTGDALRPSFTNTYNYFTNGLSTDASVDVRRTFKKPEQELSFAGQWTRNNRRTEYESSLDTLDLDYYKESSLNHGITDELTFQTDYTHPVTKAFTIETGAKAILRDVDSDYDYRIFRFASDAYEYDPVRSNVYNNEQDIVAGYLQTSLNLKKFGIKAGLRYEHTTFKGYFDKGDTRFSNEYENFVPSTTISYARQGKYSLKLSYTQRIQRPGLNFLNPFINATDPTNVTYGNPDLDAEKSHAFELGLNLFKKFGSVNLSAYHRFTDNAIESIRFVDTNDVYITTYGNIGKNRSTGMSLGLNVMWQMKIFLSSNFNLFYYQVESTGLSQNLNNDGVNWNVNLFGSYKFSKRWGVMAFGNFNGPRYSVQGKSTSFWYYNLSARREFKNEKGGIGIGLDNFASWYMHFRNNYSGEGFSYDNDTKVLFLGARISLDYRFGKMEYGGGQKKKKGIKNDDVKDDGGGGMMGR